MTKSIIKKPSAVLIATLIFFAGEIILSFIMILILGLLFGMRGEIARVINVWISVFLGTGGAAYIAAIAGKRLHQDIQDKTLLWAFLTFTFFWNGASLITATDIGEVAIRAISIVLTLGAVWISWRAGWA